MKFRNEVKSFDIDRYLTGYRKSCVTFFSEKKVMLFDLTFDIYRYLAIFFKIVNAMRLAQINKTFNLMFQLAKKEKSL